MPGLIFGYTWKQIQEMQGIGKMRPVKGKKERKPKDKK